MFKYIALAAGISLCSLNAQAQSFDNTVMSSDLTLEEASAIVTEFETFMTEITEALESVNDAASAEAAANILMSIKFRAGDLQNKMNQVTAADPQIQQELLPRIFGALVQSAARVEKATANIESNNYYGCELLRELMLELDSTSN